jgi:hypothetical protein
MMHLYHRPRGQRAVAPKFAGGGRAGKDFQLNRAIAWLRDKQGRWAKRGKTVTWADIVGKAEQAGVSESTLRRAAIACGIPTSGKAQCVTISSAKQGAVNLAEGIPLGKQPGAPPLSSPFRS